MLNHHSRATSYLLHTKHIPSASIAPTLFAWTLSMFATGCGAIECADGHNNDGTCVARAQSYLASSRVGLVNDVLARFPWNGFTTGSFRAASANTVRSPLRPKFIWNAVAGARHYQLQLDDGCSLENFRACDFSSPELNVRVAARPATAAGSAFVFRPEEDLPVSTIAPVGRRYYWRVRACARRRCSSWTEIRYLDVGRLHSDYNCDGYSDLAVGDPGAGRNEGHAFVYYGGPTGIGAVPNRSYMNPEAQYFGRFGFSIASAGDVDGDGCSDLLVGANGNGTAMAPGEAYLYLGSPTGLPGNPSLELEHPAAGGEDAFGRVAGAGDFNGDGFADIIVGADQQNNGTENEGAAYLYWGSPSGLDVGAPAMLANPGTQAQGFFGSSVAGIGDTNGDGYPEVLVGAQGQDGNAAESGSAFVYFGSPGGAPTTPTFETETTADTGALFGWSATGGGDFNADGYSDFAVGALLFSNGNAESGAVEVYLGAPSLGTSTIDAQPQATLLFRDSTTVDYFGMSLSGRGDVNGDGLADLAAGASRRPAPGVQGTGEAHVFLGAPGFFPEDPSLSYPSLSDFAVDRGRSVSTNGDLNGDGFDDFAVATPVTASGGRVDIYFGPLVGSGQSNQTISNPSMQQNDRFGYSIH